jgi:hypothetical protein
MGPAPVVGAGFSPLDAELGLAPAQRYSPRVEETLVQLSVETTFGRAVKLVQRLTGVVSSAATARRRTYAAGAAALALEAAACHEIAADPPPLTPTPTVLQLSVDATKVQLVGGEWTDVKLASFAQVVPGRDREGKPVAKALDLSYAVRWESAAPFGQTLTLEAQRRNLDGAARVVSPNDGALWIQDILDLLAPQAVRILDEPHAAEHLGLIGQLLHGPTGLAASDWVARQRRTLLEQEEGPAVVLAELDRCLAIGPHPAAPRTAQDPDPAAALVREVAYFHTRADQIRYVTFRQLGYPIGSGCVESGHGVVITPRCKRAGMRWAPDHLNPLLVLRGIDANDRWEDTAPAIWDQLQRSSRQAQRTTQQQRRTLRLVAAPTTPETLPTAPDAASPVPLLASLTTTASLVAPGAAIPSSAPPKRTRSTPSGRRRPAANHPWRQTFLAPSHRQAS